mmetsp:Transcript_18314/g.18391  ORF Transcript_18314/g.18391 Transcript_18314/m.18391 type:complete len:205 (-) Transcript_18314:80-694(-)
MKGGFVGSASVAKFDNQFIGSSSSLRCRVDQSMGLHRSKVRYPSNNRCQSICLDMVVTMDLPAHGFDAMNNQNHKVITQKSESSLSSSSKLLSTLDELDAALCTSRLVVVKFFAPWCRSCRMVTKQLNSLASKYGQTVDFYEVSMEHSEEMFEKLEVHSMPTFQVYYAGQKIDHFSVGPSRARLVSEKIAECVEKISALPSSQP